jgi:CheY-like chemotaxis protein
LIVEDLSFWQETLREILVDAGCQVWVASSYAEAMDSLAQDEFDLAMIDVVLDDTNRHNRDGLRILRHILDRQLEMCAIIVTSSDPKRIQREVNEISPDVPVLWKDRWDDEQFLAIVHDFFTKET